MSDNKYEEAYSEDDFWSKVKKYAKVAGESVLEPALKCITQQWIQIHQYGQKV